MLVMRREDDGVVVTMEPPPPPPPTLGTPPGSPPDSPRDGSEAEELALSPPPSHGHSKLTGSAKKYALSPRESLSTASTATIESGALSKADGDHDEFHEVVLDAGGGSTSVVTKSIYQAKRGGFLSRLRDVSSSMVKAKAAASDAVLPANAAQPREPSVGQVVEREHMYEAIHEANESVEIVLEEEDPIDVSIEQTTDRLPQAPPSPPEQSRQDSASHGNSGDHARRHGFRDEQDAADEEDMAPQVVIHSTESDSDSGFATLNPVITRRAKRGSASSAIATGSSISANSPILLSLPIDEDAPTSNERLVLVIHALGATGLAKVEKFGTQSTQLEMRLCESTDQLSSGASHVSFLRTALHKKGGSEAQWNQQFSTALQSRTKQMLHIAVRTHSKLLVGEAMISLASVSETLYDQHYPIYRMTTEDKQESAGHIHLQLRVVPAANFISEGYSNCTTTPHRHIRAAPGPIPAALRKGALMFKVPYHSHSLMGAAVTKRQWIAVSGDNRGETVCVTWCDPIDTTEKSRRLDVCLISEIREGARTKAFERLLQNEPASVAHETDRCFSIISKSRTLDLVASSNEEALIWIDGLRAMIFGNDAHTSQGAELPARTMEDFRHSAMVTRDASTVSMMSTTAKKQQLQHWKSTIFESARRREFDHISTCLHDGCPIDMLETGTGDTLLMLACRLGDSRLVQLCLQWRAKNDPHPEFGETALQVAVNAGHSDCLGLILRTAAESDMDSEIVNHIDSKNDAPLHVAARNGDLACVQLLLHHGADICVVEEFGRTPLHCAVLSGTLDCVAYLLDVGGDSVLNAGDHDGDTALHYAALAGVESIVKLLLESAADVHSTNVHGETALDLASREKHAGSEKLIAQYHHTNATVPADCNDPASSLLMNHPKIHSEDNDEVTDGMDGDEEEFLEDEDPEAFIEPSNSPVRRGPIDHYHGHESDCDDEEEYYVPRSGRHSVRSSVSSSCSTQPISPSARVREVLATHRQRTSLHRSAPVPPVHFHSARENVRSRYMLDVDYSVPVRQAHTERIDRDRPHFRALPQYHHSEYDEYYHPYERRSVGRENGADSRLYGGYRQYPPHSYDEYSRWYKSDYRPINTGNTMYSRHQDAWQDAYPAHHHHQTFTPPPAPPPPPPLPTSAPAEIWDTYYSDEGYPYYVNRVTGQSQWENPHEIANVPSPISVAPVAPHSVDTSASVASETPTISPDAQVRIRHAAARELKLSTAQIESSSLDSGPPGTEAQIQPQHHLSPQTDESPADLPSPCESPSSKYESRTGMKLSIDVASPQRKDALESRPVFIASPRSRSPRKKPDGRDAEMFDPSFEKSTRASSPRGKTKTIQIIELKRANNLAMALASFKITDRNDQIVQALTSLDERVVNPELLVCLQRFFPSEEEAAQLKAYTGPLKSLGPAERFFFLLLQVPDIVLRIECFLYKLQFTRSYRSVYSKIQVVKRACRDVAENYSFVQALGEFFKKMCTRSLQSFRADQRIFRTEFLPRIDEKLYSFRDDLQKASEIELLDVELQINRLISGGRAVQAFIDKTSPPVDRDAAAHDTLHRFLAESRGKLTDLEAEYEGLGQWENKLLELFGESKASCQLTPILECMCTLLDKARC